MFGTTPRPALVIVGTGMAGATVVDEVLARAPEKFSIRMFGARANGPHERVVLSALLGRFQDPKRPWLKPPEWYESHGVFVHDGVKAESIDRERKVVTGAGGKVAEPYDQLILATGSRPIVPSIEGLDRRGVFVFRTPDDAGEISAYAEDCQRAVVVGGGLLGLETACGLSSRGLDVTLVEAAPGLIARHLDPASSNMLKCKLEAMGLRVLLETAIGAVLGDGQVAGVRFHDGRGLDADMVVICCEAQPNSEAAAACGLVVERGVVVDDHLRTSDPDILAVGDCAQHRGHIYGLSAPVQEQARILADQLTGTNRDNGRPDSGPGEAIKVAAARAPKNKIELIKDEKDGLDCLDDILRLAVHNNWQELTEGDKQRAKWHGLFFRQPTPGNFMLRIRLEAGKTNALQFRVIAELSDHYGKGFCDLTTRQQIQMRWFTLGDAPEIWRRLEEVGLGSLQTGMDNVRGICGCPVAGLTPHELVDASPIIHEFDQIIVGNKEFTNLPRKFNVTITGCLENCCHSETQDIALVPAYRELEGQQVNGFNVLVGGKQGSGGYRPASPLNVFVRPEEAAGVCAEITRIFRDHGARLARQRARLAFLVEERGAAWLRAELERRLGVRLCQAGPDMRKKHQVDHLGIWPQKGQGLRDGETARYYVGFLVPVGRISTDQMRAAADLAERYGNGEIRLTVGQNIVIPHVAEHRLGALADEPLFRELPYDPSPIMRGLVACTGNDYCGLALIETKGYAVQIARELEERLNGRKIEGLTIHWSGCAAGCGLHQVATIGLQGCRSRVDGGVVDAAHVCVKGKAGPNPVVATDVMYDVPCSQLADALQPLLQYLPRK